MEAEYVAVSRQSLIELRDMLTQAAVAVEGILSGMLEVEMPQPQNRLPAVWRRIEAALNTRRVPLRTYNAISRFFLDPDNARHPVFNLTYEHFIAELRAPAGGEIATIKRVGPQVIEDLRWAFEV